MVTSSGVTVSGLSVFEYGNVEFFHGQAFLTFDKFKTELQKLEKKPNMYSLSDTTLACYLATVRHEIQRASDFAWSSSEYVTVFLC